MGSGIEAFVARSMDEPIRNVGRPPTISSQARRSFMKAFDAETKNSPDMRTLMNEVKTIRHTESGKSIFQIDKSDPSKSYMKKLLKESNAKRISSPSVVPTRRITALADICNFISLVVICKTIFDEASKEKPLGPFLPDLIFNMDAYSLLIGQDVQKAVFVTKC
jgi:hypothetical protein